MTCAHRWEANVCLALHGDFVLRGRVQVRCARCGLTGSEDLDGLPMRGLIEGAATRLRERLEGNDELRITNYECGNGGPGRAGGVAAVGPRAAFDEFKAAALRALGGARSCAGCRYLFVPASARPCVECRAAGSFPSWEPEEELSNDELGRLRAIWERSWTGPGRAGVLGDPLARDVVAGLFVDEGWRV